MNYTNEGVKQEEVVTFIQEVKEEKQREYLKSKCPETEEEKFYEGFQILCAYQMEEEIQKDQKDKLVIFHEGFDVNKTKVLIHLMKENILNKIEGLSLYMYNIYENETISIENKMFPYMKIFLKGSLLKHRGMNFTFEVPNYEYFFKEFYSEEL